MREQPSLHPFAQFWDWQLEAACRGLDPATFFHPDNERGPSRRKRDADAKAVCAICPVTQTCLQWALDVQEPYGVWGGLTVDEREQLRVAVGRQRPR